jgi:chromosome segregation ATPase
MSDVKHDTKAHSDPKGHPNAKDLEPLKADPDKAKMTAPARDAEAAKARKGDDDKPKTLHQKLKAIHDRVEHAANSPVLDGKAEEFEDCWDELDALGEGGNPAEMAMIVAAHNHLQHHAPRQASQIDALEAQLDEAVKEHQKPQAVPDTPQLSHVKQRIEDLKTRIARYTRSLPADKQRAQDLQRKVTELNMEKASK